MVLTQSRTQSLINRTIKILPQLAFLGALGLVLHRFFPLRAASLRDEAYLVVALPLLAWLWLAVFNRGSVEDPEAQVELDPRELRYTRFEEVTTLRWSEYRGYRITWSLPPQIRIERSAGTPILIDFFAFSRSQRETILETLEGRSYAVQPAPEAGDAREGL